MNHNRTPAEIETIALVCHEANRAFCAANNDHSQLPWDFAPGWQRESCINGVEFVLANPDAGDSAQHHNWMAVKLTDGWTYGPVKNPDAKRHPCLVPFEKLPPEQQAKDRVFRAIVNALAPPPASDRAAQILAIVARLRDRVLDDGRDLHNDDPSEGRGHHHEPYEECSGPVCVALRKFLKETEP